MYVCFRTVTANVIRIFVFVPHEWTPDNAQFLSYFHGRWGYVPESTEYIGLQPTAPNLKFVAGKQETT